MAVSDLDSTQQSFPPYAELSQTQGWRDGGQARIHADTNEVAEALEVSRSSRYTEGPLLGTGGMGKVVLARDARLGRDVALKVLHAERELEPDDRARFLREAQVQGQLEHPSIVPVYDIERRADGTTFFTMRRVIGRTLHAIIEDLRTGVPSSTQRFTQRELLTAFATVCLTVDYAHARGVVHRDLKPANIMLGDFGEVYVLDWGLARLVGEGGTTLEEPHTRLSMPGSFMGTPMYMAPEQMQNPDVGPGADVYSLGLILFELLTFERARDPHALFGVVEARPSVRAPQRNVAPELEAICVKATADEPTERFASARALHEALAAYLEGDRDVERRRVLAAQYALQAQAALMKADEPGVDVESHHTAALQLLRSALALDPTNADNVRVLEAILTKRPQRLPPQVVAEVKAQENMLVHAGARYSVGASLTWFLFAPLVIWMGLRTWWVGLFIVIPNLISALLAAYAATREHISYSLQLGVIVTTIVGAAATTSMFGPLVLTPTLLATFAIVLQAHPNGRIRRFTWFFALVALVVVTVIELVRPSAVLEAAGNLVLVPHLHGLPRNESIVLVMLSSVAMMSVPCMFIGRVRRALNVAQRQILLQAWQFRRFGEDLLQTKP